MSAHDSADRAWNESTVPPLEWTSGPWRFELRDDEIADISFDGRLALRSIRGVARDRDWGTIAAAVTTVTVGTDRLAVDVSLVGRDADLAARLVVEAHGERLDVRWECHANAAFLRNRLGLVVLHPPEVAGEQLAVTHEQGRTAASAYPLDIIPHQPAFDISGLRWTHGGLETALEFSGDVFEMEDQRNWTDASFKTYSTPLALPFPVQVAAGETVTQGVGIVCSADAGPRQAAPADRLELVPAGRPVPAVGTSASTGPVVAGPAPTGGFLLVEVPAHTDAWRAVLDRAVEEAGGMPLDVRIVGATGNRLDDVLDAIAPLDLVRVGAFTADSHVSEPALWRALVTGLAARGLAVETVGGTRAHSTELNRTIDRLPADIPSHSFSITPQMHATGRHQVVESIAMQRLVAQNAVRLTGGPVHVGPVTLRPRFNAVATTRTPDAEVVDLAAGYGAAVTPDATDPRQSSDALLAWTVASAAALAVDGVQSIVWFEASGPRGLGDATRAFPVATALDWLTAIAGLPLLEAASSTPGLWAIGASAGDSSTALVANLRPTEARVRVAAPHGELTVTLPPFSARRLAFD